MKRKFAMLLAVLLILSLFAGCGSSDTGSDPGTTSTPNSGTSTPDTGTPDDSAGTPDDSAGEDPDSPYNFAAGKYEVDENGFPVASYEYELPLSTTDEIFTLWTVCWTPQYIPESGFGSMPYTEYLKEETGVNIEYVIVSADQRQANFAVLMASDDLCDISAGALSFYPDTVRSAVEDEWFVNLYDYKEYMPNYMYETVSRNNIDVMSTVFYEEDMVVAFWNLYKDPLVATGYCVREDFLDKWDVDIDPAEIDTFDELHSVLGVFRDNGVQAPLSIFSTIELTPGFNFSGYNTSCLVPSTSLPYAKKTLDGKVEFTLTTEDDRDLMTMLSTWYAEGLIDRNWASCDNTTVMGDSITTDKIGVCIFTPGEIADWEAQTANPDCSWAAMPRLKKTSDQKLMYGQTLTEVSYGSWCISAKCENIPLVITYTDWHYDPWGTIIISYGVPDLCWYYNEAGEIRLGDFILNNPDGLGVAWAQCLHANNGLSDAGLQIHPRKYAYDGGERLLEMHNMWLIEDYAGEMDVPTSMSFTEEQENELNEYSNEIGTYIQENYLAFLDGSKPMSEWDAYVAELNNLGLERCREIYQEAYDSFMVRFA